MGVVPDENETTFEFEQATGYQTVITRAAALAQAAFSSSTVSETRPLENAGEGSNGPNIDAPVGQQGVTTRLGAAAAAAASKTYPSPPCPTFTVEVDTTSVLYQTEREGVNEVHLGAESKCYTMQQL